MAAKIKMTKVELKAQREALKRFTRFLPTLQLKKQQLQMQTQRVREEFNALLEEEKAFRNSLDSWIQLLDDEHYDELCGQLQATEWQTTTRNIAGVDIPEFVSLNLVPPDFDLFETPIWYDDLVEALKKIAEYTLKKEILNEQLSALEEELRITSQRVNLFEKVKIPETKDNIRRIRIFLGDEQTNAVGRAKIAKSKSEARAAQQMNE
jgi:V/A-type H+-transporting ATPase subunit D